MAPPTAVTNMYHSLRGLGSGCEGIRKFSKLGWILVFYSLNNWKAVCENWAQ